MSYHLSMLTIVGRRRFAAVNAHTRIAGARITYQSFVGGLEMIAVLGEGTAASI